MMELGQPLHAFDLDKIGDGKSVNIGVRKAKEGEEIKLLDETVKKLSTEDLVIANEKKALAIAGVMGGEDSGISDDTTSIVLESANFNATAVRRTRTKQNIKTEASDRYEKEIDPNLCETAMARMVEIIGSFGGKFEGIVDVYPKPIKEWKVKLDLKYADNLLGEKIPGNQALKILNLLGIKTSVKGKITTAIIPTIRIDLKTQEDLIEEIGRIYGYEKIKPKALISEVQPAKISEGRRKRQFL
jgi:phenylalanyl-tRNA synthetase beta chain